VPTKPRNRALSPAQVKYLKENVPAFINWMQLTGTPIGFKSLPWQKPIVEALVRKGVLGEDLRLTAFGKKVWDDKIVSKITGKEARLVVIDDPAETNA
jgi:hypothetical protein